VATAAPRGKPLLPQAAHNMSFQSPAPNTEEMKKELGLAEEKTA
jgi:hypothetical protein